MLSRSSLLLLFYLLPFCSSAQTLTGLVYREGTDSLLLGASVYFGGSTVGTVTNERGQFALRVQSDQIPLVVSHVGYYSIAVNDYNPAEPLIIYLKPKIMQLKEVTISYDGMSPEQKMKVFLREFIGSSIYARSCVIDNADEIDLRYNNRMRTLTASCNAPLIIRNKKLGYTIQYFLDVFSHSPERTMYIGNYIFKEDAISRNDKRIQRDREIAYSGSRMHFIRALWKRDLEKAGFSIYRNRYNDISADSILTGLDQQKYILANQSVFVMYKGNRLSRSQLTSANLNALIGKDGFYSTTIKWSGPMTSQRIGDLLPFEYEPKK